MIFTLLEAVSQVYLPMSYMYGKRGTCKETPLTAAIRGELYTQSYDSIDWNAARNQCAKEDMYYPHPKVNANRNFMQQLRVVMTSCHACGQYCQQAVC